MKRSFQFILQLLLLPALLAAGNGIAIAEQQAAHHQDVKYTGVFLKVVEAMEGNFEDTSDKLAKVLKDAGWNVLALYDPGHPKGCKYRARVLVIDKKEYMEGLQKASVLSLFVSPLRVALYQDETGMNVSVVNPVVINRFVASGIDDLSEKALKSIAGAIHNSMGGKAVWKEYGSTFYGSKTEGLGSGFLEDNVTRIYTARFKNEKLMNALITDVKKAIKENKKNWELLYSIDMRDKGIASFGITNHDLEAKAFEITGKSRVTEANNCPGIDHAPAFPIEVVVDATGSLMRVETLREMFRMKIYFGDTGELAFYRHIFMPGQIEDEIVSVSYPCYTTTSTNCSDN